MCFGTSRTGTVTVLGPRPAVAYTSTTSTSQRPLIFDTKKHSASVPSRGAITGASVSATSDVNTPLQRMKEQEERQWRTDQQQQRLEEAQRRPRPDLQGQRSSTGRQQWEESRFVDGMDTKLRAPVKAAYVGLEGEGEDGGGSVGLRGSLKAVTRRAKQPQGPGTWGDPRMANMGMGM